MLRVLRRRWHDFSLSRPTTSQLIIFTVINVAMTVFQLVLMPLARWALASTGLEQISFRAMRLGDYTVFDYPSGALPEGGGGLAYFLAVQITLAAAQILNFFAQRNITFKSNSNPWWAALWYFIAYIVITVAAAALQGVYKAPIYEWFIGMWGSAGETTADATTMMINALLSAAVFFPIFKLIFRRTSPEPASSNAVPAT